MYMWVLCHRNELIKFLGRVYSENHFEIWILKSTMYWMQVDRYIGFQITIIWSIYSCRSVMLSSIWSYIFHDLLYLLQFKKFLGFSVIIIWVYTQQTYRLQINSKSYTSIIIAVYNPYFCLIII